MIASPREQEPKLGSYLRVERNDHTVLVQLLIESRLGTNGLIVNPCHIARHEELVAEAGRQGVETVLDPRSVELSTSVGLGLSGVADLPWAPVAPHTPDDLGGPAGLLLSEEIVGFAVKEGLSAILAPTHILGGADDPWLQVDSALVRDLRRALDGQGRAATPIYYLLVARSALFRDKEFLGRLVTVLADLPIDAIWLRLHPFGTTTSGPVALRNYMDVCRALHAVGVPVVGEYTGTVGLPLLAFGAVGGITSGLTLGERFSLDRVTKKSSGSGFAPPPRVYLQSLGVFVSRDEARQLFEQRGMRSAHACTDAACCRRGAVDMIDNPRRHFVMRRDAEVGKLSRVPPQLRPTVYLDEMLRPASDAAVRAEKVLPDLQRSRRRLDSWRATLGAMADGHAEATRSPVPTGHRRPNS
ncbi:MAG: hypothetical protein IT195_08160 [Microthrixaceae bacterium]|nr:hypothetical protein [Microthrixaceae bacterium]